MGSPGPRQLPRPVRPLATLLRYEPFHDAPGSSSAPEVIAVIEPILAPQQGVSLLVLQTARALVGRDRPHKVREPILGQASAVRAGETPVRVVPRNSLARFRLATRSIKPTESSFRNNSRQRCLSSKRASSRSRTSASSGPSCIRTENSSFAVDAARSGLSPFGGVSSWLIGLLGVTSVPQACDLLFFAAHSGMQFVLARVRVRPPRSNIRAREGRLSCPELPQPLQPEIRRWLSPLHGSIGAPPVSRASHRESKPLSLQSRAQGD